MSSSEDEGEKILKNGEQNVLDDADTADCSVSDVEVEGEGPVSGDEEQEEEEGEESEENISDDDDDDVDDEAEPDDTNEPNPNSDSEDEAFVVKEIRKRREMSENIPNVELDTTMALDVKFSPTQLEVAIAFDDAVKSYALEEGILTHINTVKMSKPLAALAYSSSGEEIYGVKGKKFTKFLKEDGRLTINNTELFDKKVNYIDVGETCAVVGSEEGTVYVLHPDTCELAFSVKVNEEQIESIAVLDDYAYVTSANEVFAISLTKGTIDYQNEYSVDLMCGIVQGISFVAGSAKGELVLFSLSKLALQGTYRVARNTSITCITSVNDSHIAVAFDNSSVRLYSLFPNSEVGIIGMLTTFATHMSVSFDGQWLLANDSMHNCKLFSLADVDDAPPENKKRKRNKSSKHLQSSSSENKEAFFSAL